jgi:hypothetical protein
MSTFLTGAYRALAAAFSFQTIMAAAKAGAINDALGGHSFYVLNDNVMGGRSTSQVEALALDGQQQQQQQLGLLFSGMINTDGGGFASCRSDQSVRPVAIPAGATRVRLSIRGDGKLYKFLLNDGSRGGPFSSSPSFQHDILTVSSSSSSSSPSSSSSSTEWQDVTLSLKDFKPSFGGRASRPSVGPLRNEQMTTAGFMLSLKTMHGEPTPKEYFGEGIFPFRLEVRSMRFE